MIFTKADDAITPHGGFKPCCALHQFEKNQTVFTTALVFHGGDEVFDRSRGSLCLVSHNVILTKKPPDSKSEQ